MNLTVKFILLCSIFAFAGCTGGEDPDPPETPPQSPFEWARKMGGASSDEGNAAATDGAGNVYVTGRFEGLSDFGTDFGSTDTGISAGSSDVFVTKINSDGSYGWTRRMGGTGDDAGLDITADPAGGSYVTGRFSGSVDFGADFGVADLKTSAGSFDVFVTKINTDGSYGWTRVMGGSGGDSGEGIATDDVGGIYLTGDFGGTVDFGADFGGTDPKTATPGSNDVFITKIHSDGSYGWTRSAGGTHWDSGQGIAADGAGNVYAAGTYCDTVDFAADFGGTDSKISAGNNDIFIMRINGDGSYGWTRRMGGTGDDTCDAIAAGNAANIYLTGRFWGTVNFAADFGGTDTKISPGAYFTRINTDGSYGWTRRIGEGGSGSAIYGRSIATDIVGDAFFTGYFRDTVNFAADFGATDSKTSNGNRDIFVSRINPDGSYGWTRAVGGTGDDEGLGIALDVVGNIYLTGKFQDTVDFGPNITKTSAGGQDIFVAKSR